MEEPINKSIKFSVSRTKENLVLIKIIDDVDNEIIWSGELELTIAKNLYVEIKNVVFDICFYHKIPRK